ncbi:GntR family transcriptional regulator [Arthrobacter sp. StoSoilB22]|uniref:GntR family transcriptional regulator n=1 Tax=Arthrobacter sp. StoSoilB22 TaxID=2830996 RepID=UPI001CC46317|nr:GntR family transcriptional regulator [Arthrobacter sp. StoSoilB22]BCW62835.1 GntR family transcriptional regulator [Arthrobacter sp. StoSoilB22]
MTTTVAGSTELTSMIETEIRTYLRDERPALGHRITERFLAERLRVSRSPIRKALQGLLAEGTLARTEGGGYVVARSGPDVALAGTTDAGDDDSAYMQIAEDRLNGALPERVTENGLMRRYSLTRAQVGQLLRRISAEGWIAPLPGYGWEFLPVLTSVKSYRDSYHFRLVVEPAAILEDTFVLDREGIGQRMAEQQELVDGRIWTISGAELFDLNTRFHETVAQCSNNDFFIEGLARINRLRRLIEYRQALVPERAILRCAEHVELARLLLAGELRAASDHLRAHLSTVGSEKTRQVPRG